MFAGPLYRFWEHRMISDQQAGECIEKLRVAKIRFRAVESCTGGMVFSSLTAISGASAVLDRGFVTYSNDAKMDLVAVNRETLSRYGAVSAETAIEMAVGGVQNISAPTICVAITGIAGPSGGTIEKPVGLVHIATAFRTDANSPATHTQKRFNYHGDRQMIRQSACADAIAQVIQSLSAHTPG